MSTLPAPKTAARKKMIAALKADTSDVERLVRAHPATLCVRELIERNLFLESKALEAEKQVRRVEKAAVSMRIVGYTEGSIRILLGLARVFPLSRDLQLIARTTGLTMRRLRNANLSESDLLLLKPLFVGPLAATRPRKKKARTKA